MPNPQLTKEQRDKLFAPLFERVKADLEKLSGGDARLLWALRRKLTKELGYLERSTPTERNKLKARKWNTQKGLCALCSEAVEQKNSELDRFEAFLGYTDSNVRLVHHECHVNDQSKKGYT
ncbi:MAG: hypothetical protein WA435_04345 [Gallionellaceae bacterium]